MEGGGYFACFTIPIGRFGHKRKPDKLPLNAVAPVPPSPLPALFAVYLFKPGRHCWLAVGIGWATLCFGHRLSGRKHTNFCSVASVVATTPSFRCLFIKLQ